jgi:hypothetical protein
MGANTELTPPAIWSIAKSLAHRDGPRAHGLLGLQSHPVHKANAIADYLENQFTPHELCEENQALLEAVDSDPPERIRSCDLQK